MAKKRDNFRLGIWIIIMFLLLFGCLLFIGGGGLSREAMREFTVRFATGAAMPEIMPGSRVTCFGQDVGEVIETRLIADQDPDNPKVKDRLFLEVRGKALARLDLREDCQVVATGPPLGGKGVLEIVNRGLSSNLLPADKPVYGLTSGLQTALARITHELDETNPQGLLAVIKLQLDPADKASLMAKIHRSIEDINRMTASLANELDRQHADRLLYKVHGGLDRVNVALAAIVDLLQTNRPAIDSTLASVDHAMKTVDAQIVTSLAEEFDATREDGMLAQAHRAFERLNQSLSDVNTITDRAKETVVLNSARIDELVQNATEASMLLRRGIKDLALHPWKVIFPPSAAEKRELQVFNIAREFAEAAAHLDDATSRLNALLDARGGSIEPEDPLLKEIRTNLLDSVHKFFEAEQALWRELETK